MPTTICTIYELISYLTTTNPNHRFSQMRAKQTHLLILLLSASLSSSLWPSSVFAAKIDGTGYAGLEFLGSSAISRAELEKLYGVKLGASQEAAEKSLPKLQQKLEQMHVYTNMEFIPGDKDDFYLAIDVLETALSGASLPTRKLKDPRHVPLGSERPFAVLEQLSNRLSQIALEGRPSSERYHDGMKRYSDEPADGFARDEIKELSGRTRYLYSIIESDTNGKRRADAVELLNWTPEWALNCLALLPALDDSDTQVRVNADKYIWARLTHLPPDFPYGQLAERLCRQLSRPSHEDRAKALACLLVLAKHEPQTLHVIKEFATSRLEELKQASRVGRIKRMSVQLLDLCKNPPPPPKSGGPQMPYVPGTGF